MTTGNAWTDAERDNRGAVWFWHSHALISDATRDGLLRTCNFSHVGPLQVEAVNQYPKVRCRLCSLQFHVSTCG